MSIGNLPFFVPFPGNFSEAALASGFSLCYNEGHSARRAAARSRLVRKEKPMLRPREVVSLWVDAFNSHDPEALAELYHE